MDRKITHVGFTLIELLVVIGIISLLLSILIPTLNKARMMAGEKVCAGNLRQLGMALMMYADENNSRFPLEPTEHNSHPDLLRKIHADSGGLIKACYCPQAWFLEKFAQNPRYIPMGSTDSVIDTPENRRLGNISYIYWSFQSNKYDPNAAGPESLKYWRNPKVFLPRQLFTTGGKALYPNEPLPVALPTQRWVMSDFFRRKAPFPHGHKSGSVEGGLNVVFLDGHVDLVKGRPRDSFR